MLPSKYNKLDKLLKSQKLNIKSFEDKGQGKFKFLDIRVKEADRLTTFNNLRNYDSIQNNIWTEICAQELQPHDRQAHAFFS